MPWIIGMTTAEGAFKVASKHIKFLPTKTAHISGSFYSLPSQRRRAGIRDWWLLQALVPHYHAIFMEHETEQYRLRIANHPHSLLRRSTYRVRNQISNDTSIHIFSLFYTYAHVAKISFIFADVHSQPIRHQHHRRHSPVPRSQIRILVRLPKQLLHPKYLRIYRRILRRVLFIYLQLKPSPQWFIDYIIT